METHGNPTIHRWEPKIIAAWLEVQGDCVELHVRKDCHVHRAPPKRGKIKSFSRAARLRLITSINRIDWQTHRYHTFLTLTYPDDTLPNTPDDRNAHRDNFLGMLERHVGRHVTGIWRAEWEARKTGTHKGKLCPHFHLVLIGVPWLHKQLFKDWWGSVIGYRESNLHVRVDGPEGKAGAYYASKYCAKRDPHCELAIVPYLGVTGRHYGFIRKKILPWCETKIVWGLQAESIACICDAIACELPWTRADEQISCRIFGSKGKRILEKFRTFELAKGRRIVYDTLNDGGKRIGAR